MNADGSAPALDPFGCRRYGPCSTRNRSWRDSRRWWHTSQPHAAV